MKRIPYVILLPDPFAIARDDGYCFNCQKHKPSTFHKAWHNPNDGWKATAIRERKFDPKASFELCELCWYDYSQQLMDHLAPSLAD